MRCQAVVATAETNSFLSAVLNRRKMEWKRKDQERTLGWWRQQLGEQSNEMTNWGRGSSGKHRWPTETSGGPAKSQGVTWVCWQYLKDPGDSRGNTRKVRIGIESNCLGLFNHHFYSRHDLLLIGFALLRNRWEQLQDRSASGKRGDREVPEECLVNWG